MVERVESSAKIEASEPLLDPEHPWPGLATFKEADKGFFFGRSQEIADLTRMVTQEQLTVLYGRSGLGKSSLLAAGLAPALRQHKFVPVPIPLNFAEQAPPLVEQVQARIVDAMRVEKIDAPAPAPEQTLWEYFHQKDFDWWQNGNVLVKPVLILDQFEAFLSSGKKPLAGWSDALLTELSDLVQNRPPAALRGRPNADHDRDRSAYRVLVALREDFLAAFDDLREQLRAGSWSRFHLHPMAKEQAGEVILGPGRHFVSDDVAHKIVGRVSGAQSSTGLVDPAILSIFLRGLNKRRIEERSPRILGEWVEQSQTDAILDEFYQEGTRGMRDEVHDFIVESLVTSTDLRSKEPEDDAPITRDEINALILHHIIQREEEDGVLYLKLTHDILLGPVKTDREKRRKEREERKIAEAERQVARDRQQLAALQGRAEREGREIIDDFRRQLADASIAAGPRVLSSLERISADAASFPDSESIQANAALGYALGAITLYSYGWIGQGRAAAERAVALASKLPEKGSGGVPRTVVRAAAAYAEAKGLYSIGRTLEAESGFHAALEFVASDTASTDAAALDACRVRALAQLGLADVRARMYFDDEAREAYESFERDWKGKRLDDPVLLQCLARAIEGSALKQKTYADVQSRADRVRRLGMGHEHSLQWRRISCESLLLQVFWRVWSSNATSAVSLPEEARLVRTVRDQLDTLAGLDPQNLENARLQVVAQRVLGLMYQKNPNLASLGLTHEKRAEDEGAEQKPAFATEGAARSNPARDAFARMRDLAADILKVQPQWSNARYLHAVSFFYLGETSDETTELSSGQCFEEGLQRLDGLIADSADDLDAIRTAAIASIRKAQAAENGKNWDSALMFYKKAIEFSDKIPSRLREASYFSDVAVHSYLRCGWCHYASGGLADAERFCDLAEEQCRGQGPNSLQLADVRYLKSLILLGHHRTLDAEAAFRNSLEICDRTDPPRSLDLKAQYTRLWASEQRARKDYPAALAALKQAAAFALQSLRQDPLELSLHDTARDVHEESINLRTAMDPDTSQNRADNQGQPVDPADLQKLIFDISPLGIILQDFSVSATGTIDRALSPPWGIPPLISGIWHTLLPRERQTEIHTIRQVFEKRFKTPLPEVSRIRTRTMASYPDAALYEAEVTVSKERQGMLA